MRRTVVIGFSAVAMMVMGCSSGEIGSAESAPTPADPGAVASDLLIDENTDTVTRGRFITSDGQISFFATSDADTRLLRIQIDGKTFEVMVDGSVTVDGHGAVLTVAEKALLLNLSEALTARFQTETKGATRFEGLASLGSYLSEAPEGYVHLRVVNGTVLPDGVAAVTTASITCFKSCTGAAISGTLPTTSNLNLVVTYTAPLTAKIPTSCAKPADAGIAGANMCTHYGGVPIPAVTDGGAPTQCLITKPIVLGSNWGTSVCGGGNYGCMGLCGGGCSGTKYTVQCLQHDTCSHDDASTLGGNDPACGDEYSAASDDMFGSCTGYITLPAK